jgi:hypothetical protein
MSKLKEKTKTLLITYALSIGFALVLALCTMCLTYTNGKLLISVFGVLVVWLIYIAILCVANGICMLYRLNIYKNIAVMYVSTLLTVMCVLLCMRYLEMLFVPLLVCSLLTVLLVNKRSAFIIDFVCFAVVLTMYIVRWKYVDGAFQAADVAYLLIKLISSCAVIAFYQPNYNRISLIGEVVVAGLISAVLSFAVSVVFGKMDIVSGLMNGVWFLVSDIASLLMCLVLSPVFEWVLRLETNLKLLEYISFDQPLLKELSEKAPGTFHHSLAVGNLAERCANAIGENVNMAKAAAYFHDIGKLQSPEFFSENQTDGYNPHNDLTFENSVKIITRHTEVGYKMLTDHHFPKLLADVAREHHGDSTVSYFYIQALNITEGEVDSRTYRYPGPRPSNRISAIVMIADTVEAATRARKLTTREELYPLIDKLIKDKRESGQFDHCDITMRELALIRDTLVEALIGTNHKRVDYPEQKRES